MMIDKECILTGFLVGETVYLYSQKFFGKYEIKKETIMQITINNLGIFYTASNGYIFTEADIGVCAFYNSSQAEAKMKEVLNENKA